MPRIADAVELGGPKVAANPVDRWVIPVAYGIAVITRDGKVFAHPVSSSGVGNAVALPGPPTAANPDDRWVLAGRNRIIVITSDGRVFAHPLRLSPATTEPAFADRFPAAVEPAHQLPGPKVAANQQDRSVLLMGAQLLVITAAGDVFAHAITPDDRIAAAVKLSGPKVAANPQDRWVLARGSEIVVITRDGAVWEHPVRDGTVRDAHRLEGPAVAAQDVDRWVLAPDPSLSDLGLVVGTRDGRVFSHRYVALPGERPR